MRGGRVAELWLTAEEIAAEKGITERGVRKRCKPLLTSVNGTRQLYERMIRSESGGGRGGMRCEFECERLNRDFSGLFTADEMAALRERYGARPTERSFGFAQDDRREDGGQIVVTTTEVLVKHGSAQLTMKGPASSAGNSSSAKGLAPLTTLAVTTAGEASPARPGRAGLLPFTAPEIAIELATIPERARPLAEARYAAIQPLLGDKWRGWENKTVHGIAIRKKADFALALERDWKLSVKRAAVLNEWPAIRPRSASTLWTWHNWYRNGRTVGGSASLTTRRWKLAAGVVALHEPPCSTAGHSKLFGQAPQRLDYYDDQAIARELERLTPAGRRAAQLLLLEGESVQRATEQLAAEHTALGLDAPPSYGAVRSFWESFPAMLRDWAAGRAKDFHNAHAPYVLRDYSSVGVNDWWVTDHAQADYFSYSDYIPQLDRLAFPELAPNAWLRLWLTVVMDVRSRYVPGYAFSAIPSSMPLCAAFRMAVLRCGRVCRVGLLDRGEDMKKIAEEKPQLAAEAQGALLRLIRQQWGTEGRVVFSIGEHPQSKPVERLFGTMRTRFDSRVPSYCGRDAKHRSDRASQMLEQHQAFLDGKRPATPLPRASEAVVATARWIEGWYNTRHKHTGHAMGGRTPMEVYRAGWSEAEESAAQKELDPRALDVFLWDRQPRKVFRGGCVRMYSSEYEPADAASLGRLSAWQEREVLVAADPYQLGDAVAIDPQTGEFLGALRSKQLLAWGADQNLIRAEVRHQRRADKAMRTYSALLARTHRASGGPFGFLGEALPATGTDGIRALPPARPLRLAAHNADKPSSPFVDDAAKDFIAAMEEVE